jgi:predicted nuclease of restriction endonuclease-like RecB superfamily
MLTADLVIARRRGAELHLVKLDEAARSRARTIAAALIDVTNANVGNARDEVETAIDAVLVAAQDERLKAGLAKLLDDRMTWEEALGDDAVALRSALFLRAAASRKALDVGERFDRARIVAEAARENGMTGDALERAIYADLRGAQRLLAAPPISAESLVLAWERGQSQAVLLRAIKVTVDVRCATAGATRAFFHRLKFLRLLHVVTKTDEGHRVVIDGPFSLFESVTKYGLQLALVLPILDGCDSWRLEA